MQFSLLNLVLVLLFTVSTLVVALPAVSAELAVKVRSDDSVSTALHAIREALSDRRDIPGDMIPQAPATTLATVIAPAVPTTPAKGSENSKQSPYYMLQCNVGRTADECYRYIGTQCNSSTGVMINQGNYNTQWDCTEILHHCRCVNVNKEACIFHHSCT